MWRARRTLWCGGARGKRPRKGAKMQGKIALEEHFAIEETLNDSRGFFPDRVWQEVRERVLDLHGRRLRLMDEHGIEMMLLSLNAPVVQAIPDPAQADALARRANDYLAEAGAQAARALPGPRRAADAGSRARRQGARALRQRAGLQRRAGQRLLAGRRQGHHRLLRPQAVLAVLAGGRATRRAVLSAPAQSAAARRQDLRGPQLAAWARSGPSARRPRCTRCA